MSKKIIAGMLSLSLFAIGFGTAYAAPWNSNGDNIVANYSDGDHGIVGIYVLHTGADVVKRSGNSGNFQQWFEGWAFDTDPPRAVNVHSVWNVAKNGKCPNSEWTLVPNASASWGDYLVAGADYCVKNNEY